MMKTVLRLFFAIAEYMWWVSVSRGSGSTPSQN